MSAAISYPVLVDVTAEYVTASVNGISHCLPWYLLRAAACQADRELSIVYERLLDASRAMSRQCGLMRRRYSLGGASGPSLPLVLDVVRAEWPELLRRRRVDIIEVDPDLDAPPDGVVVGSEPLAGGVL